MPTYNKLERAHLIMRYVTGHPEKNSYETLSRALQMASSSIRKSVLVDYPATFTRNAQGNIGLSEPLIWPDDVIIDLGEPVLPEELIDKDIMSQPDEVSRLWTLVDKLTDKLPGTSNGHEIESTKATGTSKEPEKKFGASFFKKGMAHLSKYLTPHALSELKDQTLTTQDNKDWTLINTLRTATIMAGANTLSGLNNRLDGKVTEEEVKSAFSTEAQAQAASPQVQQIYLGRISNLTNTDGLGFVKWQVEEWFNTPPGVKLPTLPLEAIAHVVEGLYQLYQIMEGNLTKDNFTWDDRTALKSLATKLFDNNGYEEKLPVDKQD